VNPTPEKHGLPRGVPAPADSGPDPVRTERMVAAIMARARPELDGLSAAGPSPGELLVRWSPQVLTAAAAVILLSVVTVGLSGPGDVAGEAQRSLAEYLAPAPVAEWLEGGAAPTAGELLLAMEGGG